MPRDSQSANAPTAERQVEALIIKNTSVAGMMLHRNTRHMLPISLAKSLRDQKLAVPIPKAKPSHPVPPPPPVVDEFDGEDEDGESKDSDDEEEEGE